MQKDFVLENIVNSIKGLKMQSMVALNSQGKNNLIDRNALLEAQRKIVPSSLRNIVLKEYMQEKNIKSFVDIDENDFINYYNSF